jgi:hypothetical protein
LRLQSHISFKSCGIAIAEAPLLSCGIAILDSKKSCVCPPLRTNKNYLGRDMYVELPGHCDQSL